jgi:hypothetical protein
MRPLSPAELLSIWEHGAGSSPARRAWLLLEKACDDTPADRVARFTVGQRDARLLELRERIFGEELNCLTNCPNCDEPLQWQMTTSELCMSNEDETGFHSNLAFPLCPDPSTGGSGNAAHAPLPSREVRSQGEGRGSDSPEAFALQQDHWNLTFCLPTSADLAALSPHESLQANRSRLLRACLLDVERGGQVAGYDELPLAVSATLVQCMAQLDPQSEVQVDLHCPQCGHHWPAVFDIASFFWTELSAWAARLLRDVHELASAYGWRESEILALSPQRRRAYLELVRG